MIILAVAALMNNAIVLARTFTTDGAQSKLIPDQTEKLLLLTHQGLWQEILFYKRRDRQTFNPWHPRQKVTSKE